MFVHFPARIGHRASLPRYRRDLQYVECKGATKHGEIRLAGPATCHPARPEWLFRQHSVPPPADLTARTIATKSCDIAASGIRIPATPACVGNIVTLQPDGFLEVDTVHGLHLTLGILDVSENRFSKIEVQFRENIGPASISANSSFLTRSRNSQDVEPPSGPAPTSDPTSSTLRDIPLDRQGDTDLSSTRLHLTNSSNSDALKPSSHSPRAVFCPITKAVLCLNPKGQ